MQLKNIRISNLICFPPLSGKHSSPAIDFSVGGKRNNVHMLIGPNGSGKSSFLEIINQIFKVGLSRDYVYHREFLRDKKKHKQVVSEHRMYVHNLRRHFKGEDKKSFVELTLVLQSHDYNNLKFLCRYREEINAIIRKYSTIKVEFPAMDFVRLKQISEVFCHFSIDLEKHTVSLSQKNISEEESFVMDFVLHHELIQIAMQIYNERERKKTFRKWYPLKNTYAILGSNRHFDDIVNDSKKLLNVSEDDRSTYLSGQNTKSYFSLSLGYYLCLIKLWESFPEHARQKMDVEKAVLAVQEEDFFLELNAVVKKYLHMDLYLSFESNNLLLFLQDKYGRRYDLRDLSSGDQSMLLIILTIFGYDLQSGLLIIDEPELHLHPQKQKEFLVFIERVAEEFRLQVILATHSPLMINEKNIKNVYRFHKTGLETSVHHPAHRVFYEEAELIHMLKFENIAKVFFVDKIILVEGETDVYFFDYYLHYLKEHNSKFADIQNYEFLNINGKGGASKWKYFLKKFAIDVYYIGDWDNVVDHNILSSGQMRHYRKLSRNYQKEFKEKYHFLSKRRYGVMVETIKKTSRDLYNYIEGQIESYYSKGIFFLQRGDLESYIGIRTKGLDDTINFCQKKFSIWLENTAFDPHRQELNRIFGEIFGGSV